MGLATGAGFGAAVWAARLATCSFEDGLDLGDGGLVGIASGAASI